jgi:hypothetical protein
MDLLRRFGNALNPSPIDIQQWKVELSQEWNVSLHDVHVRLSRSEDFEDPRTVSDARSRTTLSLAIVPARL